MRLDPVVLRDLSIAYEPRAYIRAMPLLHRATPLGMGFGRTRYASPSDSFKLLYVAEDLRTSVAETLIRDRFENRKRRRITQAEAKVWGAVQIDATAPLILVDLRTTGLLRLGVSTDAGRAKAQVRGRSLSQAIYDGTDADGILCRSRLTNGVCCAVYDRAVGKLAAGAVSDLVTLAAFVPALRDLGVEVVASR